MKTTAIVGTMIFLSFGSLAAGEPKDAPVPDAQAIRKGNLLASKAFRAAAKRVMPSLVTIESFGGSSSAQGKIGGILKQGEGPSTGLVISADGYIVTSTFNFVKKPPIITIIFSDGTRRVAELVGRDDTRKICLLKVNGATDLPVPQFIPRAEMRVGQWAISVGIGYGDTDPALSAGIISATSRISGRAVQTDANTSPANYGGPLVDIEGRVFGICVPLSPRSGTGSGVEWYDSGIGFAIPLHGADTLLAALKAGKTIRAGFLGVQVKTANADGSGVKVQKVQPGSAAEKAEVKDNDIILAVDGTKVLDPAHLKILISKHIAGEKIKLLVKRGDEEKEIEATLGEAPPKKPAGRPRITPQPGRPKP